jgi:predicted MPP superfamily phosphohydrolase
LQGLKHRHGIYFITGNHEYYSGAEAWIAENRRLGFEPLLNEHRVLKIGDASLVLAGVTDHSDSRFTSVNTSDPMKAMAGAPRDAGAKILLAHQPRSCFKAGEAGFDLQISGHTHAGQTFPGSLIVPFAHPYYKGLNRHGKMWVYVNRGTGYWGPPLRLGVPSEITLLTLVQKVPGTF